MNISLRVEMNRFKFENFLQYRGLFDFHYNFRQDLSIYLSKSVYNYLSIPICFYLSIYLSIYLYEGIFIKPLNTGIWHKISIMWRPIRKKASQSVEQKKS